MSKPVILNTGAQAHAFRVSSVARVIGGKRSDWRLVGKLKVRTAR